MKKDFNILPLVFALAILSFSACGVKKNATAEVNAAKATQPATTEQTETATDKSLAQRIAAGEFAWLDTIQIDTSSIPKSIIGQYILDYYEKNDDKIYPVKAAYDSLVFQKDGHYKLFKRQQLIDFGKYNVTMVDTLNHCFILALTASPEKCDTTELELHNISILTAFSHTGIIEKYICSIRYVQYYNTNYKEFNILCNINECYIPGYTQQFWKTDYTREQKSIFKLNNKVI